MDDYLRSTALMDYDHPEVRSLARALGDGVSDPTTIAKRSFEWVRDEIRHSGDFQVNQPTCAASEVLRHGAGWCFAKSHLLAALLRVFRSLPRSVRRVVSLDGLRSRLTDPRGSVSAGWLSLARVVCDRL